MKLDLNIVQRLRTTYFFRDMAEQLFKKFGVPIGAMAAQLQLKQNYGISENS